jgi:LysR family transcriptional regulator, glycine cleavage system transcriptional activator
MDEPRGPSLNAVRAFEAAARLGGFTAAARELKLTQSAVSRHVRTLEDEFGVPLFERRGRSVVLSEAGSAYYSAVTEGLHSLRRASVDMYRRRRASNQVTISLLPSLAALWLAPRLVEFTAQHPGVDLRVHTSRAVVDMRRDGIDVCIRYGLGTWPDVEASRLVGEWLTPVCSPEFARSNDLFDKPERVTGLKLLRDDIVDGWEPWLEAAGLAGAKLKFGPVIDESTTLLKLAASGAGLALGRSLLIERDLAEGRLVAPFKAKVPARYSYWLVTPHRGESNAAARTLIEWLKRQSALT